MQVNNKRNMKSEKKNQENMSYKHRFTKEIINFKEITKGRWNKQWNKTLFLITYVGVCYSASSVVRVVTGAGVVAWGCVVLLQSVVLCGCELLSMEGGSCCKWVIRH